MRACQRGWEYAQITGENGEVEICSWATFNYHVIGKLSEKSMYEIWHSEDAEIFRKSLIDGSYCYCEKQRCPWMANGTLENHMKDYDDVLEYPTEVALAYERTCNYSCTCCVDKNNSKLKDENLAKLENELTKFLNSVRIISANGRGELFTSNHILRLLQNWKPQADAEEIEVILETNGSMFDEEHWMQIQNLGKYKLKVSITVMGFDEATYQFLSGTTYPVKRIINNLHFVKKLREMGIVNIFEIGTVIQERNFREMPSFINKCIGEFNVDIVRLRSYFPFGDLDMGVKWIYDIRNPKHPYFPEYEKVMADPIFKHERVMMWSGDELSSIESYPYSKDKLNFDVIKFFATDESITTKLENYFNENNYEAIAVYGLGYTGAAFVNKLYKTGIKIDAIIDKSKFGESYQNYIVIKASDYQLNPLVPIVVTSPYFYDEIRREIYKQNNAVKVLNISDIINAIEK